MSPWEEAASRDPWAADYTLFAVREALGRRLEEHHETLEPCLAGKIPIETVVWIRVHVRSLPARIEVGDGRFDFVHEGSTVPDGVVRCLDTVLRGFTRLDAREVRRLTFEEFLDGYDGIVPVQLVLPGQDVDSDNLGTEE